jgi:hypothetical protein
MGITPLSLRSAAAPAPPLWMEWLHRYGPAELLALVTAFAGYFAAEALTGSHTAAAFGAAVGDNVGYYGVLVVRQLRADRRLAGRYGAGGTARTLRRLLVEFGPGETLDATVIRPALTLFAVAALGPAAGVIAGKIAADLVFYVPVISAYEASKRWSSRTRPSRRPPT